MSTERALRVTYQVQRLSPGQPPEVIDTREDEAEAWGALTFYLLANPDQRRHRRRRAPHHRRQQLIGRAREALGHVAGLAALLGNPADIRQAAPAGARPGARGLRRLLRRASPSADWVSRSCLGPLAVLGARLRPVGLASAFGSYPECELCELQYSQYA
jgi:hypothetical protein